MKTGWARLSLCREFHYFDRRGRSICGEYSQEGWPVVETTTPEHIKKRHYLLLCKQCAGILNSPISPFEYKTLFAISKGAMVSGNGMVAYSAAARRLEKKGLAGKSVHWHLTEDGHKLLIKLGVYKKRATVQ